MVTQYHINESAADQLAVDINANGMATITLRLGFVWLPDPVVMDLMAPATGNTGERIVHDYCRRLAGIIEG